MSEIITKTTGGYIATIFKNGREQRGFGRTEELAIERAHSEGYSNIAMVKNVCFKNKNTSEKAQREISPTIKNNGTYLHAWEIDRIVGFQYANVRYRYFYVLDFSPAAIKSDVGRGEKFKLEDVLKGIKLVQERNMLKLCSQKEKYKIYVERIEKYLEERKAS